MVDVIVGGEHTGHAHLVFGDDVEQSLHVIRRVDQHGVAGVAVTDGVDEVHHLPGDRIALGEVTTRQQLAEIQAIGHAAQRRGLPIRSGACGGSGLGGTCLHSAAMSS